MGQSLTIVQELSKFQNLLHVDVSFNKLKDLNFLKGVVTLESLLFAGNLVDSITDFSHMMKLAMLDCSYNKFSDINTL
jgi:Leucine-rich repeat (LRR) protein